MPVIVSDCEIIIKRLLEGGVAAIPTETVYGLAGLISHPKAIQQIYQLKHRPLDHPLIVHIANEQQLAVTVETTPNYAKALMKAFWPGPLTLVMQKHPNVPTTVTGGQESVAVRMPAHPLLRKVLAKLPAPCVAPSANRFGKLSPTTSAAVAEAFQDEPLTILEGQRCEYGIESTIVDVRNENQCILLRAGSIAVTEIAQQLAYYNVEMVVPQKKIDIAIPGNVLSHYAPTKPLYLFQTSEELAKLTQEHGACYVLALTLDNLPHGITMPSNASEYAFELYHQLRLADQNAQPVIAIEIQPNWGDAWAGIYDKLLRASHSTMQKSS